MASVKITMQRGKTNLKDIVVAAGSAEAQSDTMSLNVDYTKWSKGDLIVALEAVKQKIAASKWPMI